MLDPKDFSLSSYDYELDPNLIAQKPLEPRHEARLMLVSEEGQDDEVSTHHKVWDIQNELKEGDLLVLNDTRVLKARLRVVLSSGREVEVLILEPLNNGCWLCLAKPAKSMKPGDHVLLVAEGKQSIQLEVISLHSDTGGRIIKFPEKYCDRKNIQNLLEDYGEVPLPPYIKSSNSNDIERYQTRYAQNPGAVAAPTAGLHLSDELLKALINKGIQSVKITLHVGIGTFRPLKNEDLNDLTLHSEWVEVKEEVVKAIKDCHSKGRRVFAVGTTCVRALESAYQLGGGNLKPINTKVSLVIKPGYQFGVVDGLLTNFHLPRSSLLLLVSAFIGRKRLLTLYRKAIRSQFRFFSYGDAMLIKPEAVSTSVRS